jgi:hypothetical protein
MAAYESWLLVNYDCLSSDPLLLYDPGQTVLGTVPGRLGLKCCCLLLHSQFTLTRLHTCYNRQALSGLSSPFLSEIPPHAQQHQNTMTLESKHATAGSTRVHMRSDAAFSLLVLSGPLSWQHKCQDQLMCDKSVMVHRFIILLCPTASGTLKLEGTTCRVIAKGVLAMSAHPSANVNASVYSKNMSICASSYGSIYRYTKLA